MLVFFFLIHPNFSALVTFLLWWSSTNVGGLCFSLGENHPLRATTSYCGPGAPRRREDEKWDKAKCGNGGFCFSSIVLLRENPQISGLSPSQAPLAPHTALQTKDKLEQGTKKDLGHQGLRAERQGTRIQSNDSQIKRQRSESWWLTEEGEDEEANTMIAISSSRDHPSHIPGYLMVPGGKKPGEMLRTG